MKIKIIMWLVSLLNGEYIVVRREWIRTIALDVNEFPLPKNKTKITVLRLLRSDGSDLKSALQIYEDWNQ